MTKISGLQTAALRMASERPLQRAPLPFPDGWSASLCETAFRPVTIRSLARQGLLEIDGEDVTARITDAGRRVLEDQAA